MAGMNRPLMRSFAGGEITPELFARLDLDKFQTGLAKARNFLILPHGPAANRPGFAFVNEAKDSTQNVKLIPFSYSTTQTMVLEFGHQYIRFHTTGGTLLEANKNITGLTAANPGVFTIAAHGYVVGEWLWIASLAGPTILNGRWYQVGTTPTGNTFTLKYLDGTAVNTTALPAYTAGGTAARVYTITTPYLTGDVFDLHYTQSADVLTLTHPTWITRELRRLGATNWTLTTVAFAPTIAAPASTGESVGGPGGGTPVDHFYVSTAVSADTFEESVASPPSAAANRDLTVAGNYVDVTPAAVTGALRYNIYKLANGGLYGYIGQSDGTAFRDNNIIPDMSQTPPEDSDPFIGTGNHPSTVTYVEQRRAFAATDNRPEGVWMTRSATESNMCQSVPVRDDDAIIFNIKSNQNNRIRHLVPLGDLIALTAGSEYRVYAANSDVLTPASVTPKPQSSVGASNVQPVVAENSVLYAQASGGHMRELAYSGEGINGRLYNTNDISILAPHLFDGYTVVDMAFSRTSTCPILWVVRSDGVLLGMTYVPGQNVRAWHRHDSDGGLFKSVCCVTEGSEDVLYAVVQRTIGARSVRYIERLHTRQIGEQADAFFVDSGLTYDGTPVTSVSGLWHLEGQSVVALADGAVVTGLTVASGSVPLPAAASVVHVGKAITAQMDTLPLSWQSEGFGQAVVKNVNKVHVRVSASGAFFAGPLDGTLREVKRRTDEPYGTAPALKTQWDHLTVDPKWQDDGAVTIEHTNPLPLTVLAILLDVTSGG